MQNIITLKKKITTFFIGCVMKRRGENMSLLIIMFKHCKEDVKNERHFQKSKTIYMQKYRLQEKNSITDHFSTVITTLKRLKLKIGSMEESLLQPLGGRSQWQAKHPSQQTSEEASSLGYRGSVPLLRPWWVLSKMNMRVVKFCRRCWRCRYHSSVIQKSQIW